MSRLSRAETWLAAKLKAIESVTVTYSRNSQSVSLSATVDTDQPEVVDSMGIPVKIVDRSYVFTASDLAFSGTAFEPRVGDRITETIAGSVEVYEVMPIDKKPPFERTPHGASVKVHTKRVSIA